jgi:hypothetical protein
MRAVVLGSELAQALLAKSADEQLGAQSVMPIEMSGIRQIPERAGRIDADSDRLGVTVQHHP